MSYFLRQYTGEAKPLAKVLSAVYPELPYALLRKLIRQKDVFVNGTRQGEGSTVSRGDTLDLFCAPAMIRLIEVYRDEHLLALYKPKGVPTTGEHSFASLVAYVYGEEVQPLHRLDTNTDGIVLFSTSSDSYATLYDAMHDHRITKYYRALVAGDMQAKHLAGYLSKDADKGLVRIYDAPQKDAVSVACDVRPIASARGLTLVDVTLKGGKTHQLRAQLAHDGHFILGDGKYGDDRLNRKLGYTRQQLTAYRVVLDVPSLWPAPLTICLDEAHITTTLQ